MVRNEVVPQLRFSPPRLLHGPRKDSWMPVRIQKKITYPQLMFAAVRQAVALRQQLWSCE
jgi:hypothetical protein